MCDDVLERILACQNGANRSVLFDDALREIQCGQKQSHWIWYVWPALKSSRSTRRPELELPNFAAARAYLRHDMLRLRILSITAEATSHLARGTEKETLFGVMW